MTERPAMRFAAAAAALKCTRYGGILGAPTRAEVEAFLATSSNMLVTAAAPQKRIENNPMQRFMILIFSASTGTVRRRARRRRRIFRRDRPRG